MSILWNKYNQTITLNTKHSSYQMKIGPGRVLLHTYYGGLIQDDASYAIICQDRGFSGNPYDAGSNRAFSLDILPQEYPCHGSGDYRTTALSVTDQNNVSGCDLRYVRHTVQSGKYSIPNLPAVYSDCTNAQTLVVTMQDVRLNLQVELYYGVLEDADTITRAVIIKNCSEQTVNLNSAYSASVDFLNGNFDIIHFQGRYGAERIKERTHIDHGMFSICSRRGTSSHQHNPFVILSHPETVEQFGECWGFSLLYSGSFSCVTEQDQINQTRLLIGIQPERFQYSLAPQESFVAPEVAMIYSAQGFEALSHRFHNLIRNHVCRGNYQFSRRPILINNWEATYFDFNSDKLFNIAKQAAELGVELMVLDDGWFGNRNSDNSGLGDWFVNEEKIQGTLEMLSQKINSLGMQFGLWIEPEMVNEDSELYREHPDWAFVIPGKPPVRSRNQLVLDFSRKEVVDYILNRIFNVLDSANINYIKMDMNRSINDVYSAVQGNPSEGKILYHYILGVYNFMERLLQRYPHLLLEGCSGGGGRFDAGMLYYCPQIWCSDNTDAISRLHIQYGTSFGYPISSVGSHVSIVPNHQTGREVDFNTRGIVAMPGSFGYELDLNLISEAEKKQVKQQIANYKKYWHLLHNGHYYRLTDCEHDREKVAWMFVAKDKSEALVQVVTCNTHCNAPIQYFRCRGLQSNAVYREQESGRDYFGSALMNVGLPVCVMNGEYKAYQLYFLRV